MTDEEIYQEITTDFTREKIIGKAIRDEEKPFGFLITYIRDVYGRSKTQGWDIAMRVLDHFGIDNENY